MTAFLFVFFFLASGLPLLEGPFSTSICSASLFKKSSSDSEIPAEDSPDSASESDDFSDFTSSSSELDEATGATLFRFFYRVLFQHFSG